MKISEVIGNKTETYSVKFWYSSAEGYDRQMTKEFYSNSKQSHSLVEKVAMKLLSKQFNNVRIISVVYN